MDVRISARHCTITETTRELARKRMQRMTRFEPRAAAAEILFSEVNAFKQAEIRLSVPGSAPMHARGEGDTFRSALDRAAERLARQVRRHRTRSTDRRAAPASQAMAR